MLAQRFRLGSSRIPQSAIGNFVAALPRGVMSDVAAGLRLTPRLTPHGRLGLAPSDDAAELEPALAERLQRAFERGAGHGLLRLGD